MFRLSRRSAIFLFAITLLGNAGHSAADGKQSVAFETNAPQAILLEAETGTILFAKNPDAQIAPAALVKLMTMEVVFDALKSGRVTLDDVYTVSENAWRTGGAPSRGSTMFAALNSKVSLRDLIQGAIVQSANDACIIIAEGMAGSEQAFTDLMNKRAKAIGLTNSVFKNATGLPAEGQTVSLRELNHLALHIWKNYPEYYALYSQPDFTWNKIFQRNRNPLLRLDIGADGLGTGYTEASGYAIVGSAEQSGRRLFLAMAGMESDAERAQEARKLIEYGMDGFDEVRLFDRGDVVGAAQVFGGQKSSIQLKTQDDVEVFIPKAQRDTVRVNISYQGPLKAPIAHEASIATLQIWIGQDLARSFELASAEPVALGSLGKRAGDAAFETAFGWLRSFQ